MDPSSLNSFTFTFFHSSLNNLMSRLLSFSKIKLKLGPPESIPAVKFFCLNEHCRTQIVIWMPFNITQCHQPDSSKFSWCQAWLHETSMISKCHSISITIHRSTLINHDLFRDRQAHKRIRTTLIHTLTKLTSLGTSPYSDHQRAIKGNSFGINRD